MNPQAQLLVPYSLVRKVLADQEVSYQGKILVQASAENLKCKFLCRYMSCPQTFAKIPTDQRELCERGYTVQYHTRVL